MDAEHTRVWTRAAYAIMILWGLIELYRFSHHLNCAWYPEEFSILRFEHSQAFAALPMTGEKLETCTHLLVMKDLDPENADLLASGKVKEPLLLKAFSRACEELDDSKFMQENRECMKKLDSTTWEKYALDLIDSLNLYVPYAYKCSSHPLSTECHIWKEAMAVFMEPVAEKM